MTSAEEPGFFSARARSAVEVGTPGGPDGVV
jgi:hypothetical protein